MNEAEQLEKEVRLLTSEAVSNGFLKKDEKE
jgi:hypothetical protein